MVTLRYLVAMAGTAYSRRKGDVAEVPDAEAARLIAAGFATEVKPAENEPVGTLTVNPKPRETRGLPRP